jgi:hypothetical protein
VEGVLHHPIHEVILVGVAELDSAVPVDDGNNKTLKHLMIEVLAYEKSGVLIAFEKGLFRLLR